MKKQSDPQWDLYLIALYAKVGRPRGHYAKDRDAAEHVAAIVERRFGLKGMLDAEWVVWRLETLGKQGKLPRVTDRRPSPKKRLMVDVFQKAVRDCRKYDSRGVVKFREMALELSAIAGRLARLAADGNNRRARVILVGNISQLLTLAAGFALSTEMTLTEIMREARRRLPVPVEAVLEPKNKFPG